MKALVVYFSQTGNTEKIANAIYEVIAGKHEVSLEKLRNISPKSTIDYDLVLVGSPCIDSDLAVVVKKFLDDLPDSPKFKLAGFYTHATWMTDREGQGGLFSEWAGRCLPSFEQACKSKQIEFLGAFHCMGIPNPGIEQFIRQQIITDDKEWESYLPDIKTRPNEEDVENARKFAKEVISKLS
ncbi:MAG: flavodoxin family protein [Candidatus Thorarchaeota archaeon]